VDPLLDETGQPYAYTGDDPVNAVDPSGESGISAGTICGEDGLNSTACKGAIQISQQVGKQVAANQVSGCVPVLDAWNSVVSLLDVARHFVVAHKLATAGLALGTISIAIPGGQESAGILDAESIDALSSGSDLTPASYAQTAKTISGDGRHRNRCIPVQPGRPDIVRFGTPRCGEPCSPGR
jgi:hypothetical protein